MVFRFGLALLKAMERDILNAEDFQDVTSLVKEFMENLEDP